MMAAELNASAESLNSREQSPSRNRMLPDSGDGEWPLLCDSEILQFAFPNTPAEAEEACEDGDWIANEPWMPYATGLRHSEGAVKCHVPPLLDPHPLPEQWMQGAVIDCDNDEVAGEEEVILTGIEGGQGARDAGAHAETEALWHHMHHSTPSGATYHKPDAEGQEASGIAPPPTHPPATASSEARICYEAANPSEITPSLTAVSHQQKNVECGNIADCNITCNLDSNAGHLDLHTHLDSHLDFHIDFDLDFNCGPVPVADDDPFMSFVAHDDGYCPHVIPSASHPLPVREPASRQEAPTIATATAADKQSAGPQRLCNTATTADGGGSGSGIGTGVGGHDMESPRAWVQASGSKDDFSQAATDLARGEAGGDASEKIPGSGRGGHSNAGERVDLTYRLAAVLAGIAPDRRRRDRRGGGGGGEGGVDGCGGHTCDGIQGKRHAVNRNGALTPPGHHCATDAHMPRSSHPMPCCTCSHAPVPSSAHEEMGRLGAIVSGMESATWQTGSLGRSGLAAMAAAAAAATAATTAETAARARALQGQVTQRPAALSNQPPATAIVPAVSPSFADRRLGSGPVQVSAGGWFTGGMASARAVGERERRVREALLTLAEAIAGQNKSRSRYLRRKLLSELSGQSEQQRAVAHTNKRRIQSNPRSRERERLTDPLAATNSSSSRNSSDLNPLLQESSWQQQQLQCGGDGSSTQPSSGIINNNNDDNNNSNDSNSGSHALLSSPLHRLEQATIRVAYHFLEALARKADGTAGSKWREPLPYSLEESMATLNHQRHLSGLLWVDFAMAAVTAQMLDSLACPPSPPPPPSPPHFAPSHSCVCIASAGQRDLQCSMACASLLSRNARSSAPMMAPSAAHESVVSVGRAPHPPPSCLHCVASAAQRAPELTRSCSALHCPCTLQWCAAPFSAAQRNHGHHRLPPSLIPPCPSAIRTGSDLPHGDGSDHNCGNLATPHTSWAIGASASAPTSVQQTRGQTSNQPCRCHHHHKHDQHHSNRNNDRHHHAVPPRRVHVIIFGITAAPQWAHFITQLAATLSPPHSSTLSSLHTPTGCNSAHNCNTKKTSNTSSTCPMPVAPTLSSHVPLPRCARCDASSSPVLLSPPEDGYLLPFPPPSFPSSLCPHCGAAFSVNISPSSPPTLSQAQDGAPRPFPLNNFPPNNFPPSSFPHNSPLSPSPSHLPSLRVTGIDFGLVSLSSHPTGLASEAHRFFDLFARDLPITFQYKGVEVEPHAFRPDMVEVRPGEEVVVCSCWSLMVLPDNQVLRSNPRDAMLQWIRCLNPRVFLLAELDINLNGPFFLPRFRECLRGLSSILQASDVAMPDAASRPVLAIWEAFFSRMLLNVLGCEGVQRWVRCELMEQWTDRMHRMGFQAVPLGERAWGAVEEIVEGVSERVGSEEVEVRTGNRNGAARLMWRGTPMVSVSAWR